MALTQDDFNIPSEKLAAINQAIETRVAEFYEQHPDEDPLDAVSVTFNFCFGWGRAVDVSVAGKTVTIDLD